MLVLYLDLQSLSTLCSVLYPLKPFCYIIEIIHGTPPPHGFQPHLSDFHKAHLVQLIFFPTPTPICFHIFFYLTQIMSTRRGVLFYILASLSGPAYEPFHLSLLRTLFALIVSIFCSFSASAIRLRLSARSSNTTSIS